MNRRKIGTRLLQGVGLGTAFGGLVADWNKTHVFNPAWPPHARFHSSVIVFTGLFAGLGTLFLSSRKKASNQDLAIAAALPAGFFLSQAISLAVPGAKGLDAEFPDALPKVRGYQINELDISLAFIALAGAGYLLARRRDRVAD